MWRGACTVGGHAWQGEKATTEDGTHPTGMHSCDNYVANRDFHDKIEFYILSPNLHHTIKLN